MRALRMYPDVKVIGQDLSKCKVVTVPKQSLSLKQIIERYTRKMPLTVSSVEGFYDERWNVDLEKMAKADMTYQFEYAAELKRRGDAIQARLKAEHDAAVAAKIAADAEKLKAEKKDEPPKV